jgi:hypothetical protein
LAQFCKEDLKHLAKDELEKLAKGSEDEGIFQASINSTPSKTSKSARSQLQKNLNFMSEQTHQQSAMT